MLASRLASYFNSKAGATHLGKDQYSLLLESGYFNVDYYSNQCGEHFSEVLQGLTHYLEIGFQQGLDPNDNFNTLWYLQNNSDVAQSGINPLLHYVLFGEEEGRSPCPEQHSPAGFTSPDICNKKLWGGFSHYALSKLEALANSENKSYRAQSSWHLARWYYVHGEIGKTLNEIRLLEQQQSQLSKKIAVGQAKCLISLGETQQYIEFLGREDVQAAAGDELVYLQANAELLSGPNEAGWLNHVNSLFVNAGLYGIRKGRADKPLGLDNLILDCPEEMRPVFKNAAKVSVVIPAFNAAETIHIALNSLINQTWPNLEIIVVDDASTDQTGTVVKEFCSRFSNIKYECNTENMGAYPTRNRGCLSATGDFVTVHDSDDWSHPQKIEMQIAVLLTDTSKVASYTNWVRVNTSLAFVGPWLLCEGYVEKNHSSTLIRRELIEKHGVWDPVNVGADTEFLWRIEKIYGTASIVEVLPKVPFSFALALDGSLTQTKMTHVKTVYYGLRRLYREAAAWWHTTESDKLYLDPTQRKFPFPLGNNRRAQTEFDAVVAGDFSCSNIRLDELLEHIRNLATSRSLVLFHWPDYRLIGIEPVASEVFALCMELGVTFTHTQYQISARAVYLFDAALLEWAPDSLPIVNELEEARILDGETSEAEGQRLRELFSAVLKSD